MNELHDFLRSVLFPDQEGTITCPAEVWLDLICEAVADFLVLKTMGPEYMVYRFDE